MELQKKVLSGLERLSEVFKTLIWEKAKIHALSPIQIQILIFVSNHRSDLCNVSQLAKELSVTKPTISDAIRVLLEKGYLEKDFSPSDNRRYNVLLSKNGDKIINELHSYSLPILSELENLNNKELNNLFGIITNLIYQLNQKGIIQVQRTCFGCRYYSGNRKENHYCNLLDKKLTVQKIRLDCPEFEEKAA